MDLPSTLVIIMVGAAILGWLAGAHNGRALDAFGLGFIGYRSYGWPHGVQEEEPVHFSFSESRAPDAGDDVGPAAGFGEEPEIVELTRPPEGEVRIYRIG